MMKACACASDAGDKIGMLWWMDLKVCIGNMSHISAPAWLIVWFLWAHYAPFIKSYILHYSGWPVAVLILFVSGRDVLMWGWIPSNPHASRWPGALPRHVASRDATWRDGSGRCGEQARSRAWECGLWWPPAVMASANLWSRYKFEILEKCFSIFVMALRNLVDLNT